MRRTMFVEPLELVPVVHAACARANGGPAAPRDHPDARAEPGSPTIRERWLAEVEAETLDALALRWARRPRSRSPRTSRASGTRSRSARARRWQGTIGVSTRVLFGLAAEGRIVRGRPRGSWISSQYRWATDRVVVARRARRAADRGRPGRAHPALAAGVRPGDGRRHQVVDRLDARRGPPGAGRARRGRGRARRRDRMSSWPTTSSRRPTPAPWVAFLPALDPTVMGWTGRDWYLGDAPPDAVRHERQRGPDDLVGRPGRRRLGQRRDGEIAMRLLEDVGVARRPRAIEAEADRLGRWLGPVRITPRFRTPLELDLSRRSRGATCHACGARRMARMILPASASALSPRDSRRQRERHASPRQRDARRMGREEADDDPRAENVGSQPTIAFGRYWRPPGQVWPAPSTR